MFTGLIEEVGRVRSVTLAPTGAQLAVEAQTVLEGSAVGDSVAVNGCCLTLTEVSRGHFTAHAGTETLQRTTVPTWRPGQAVNLERALTPSSRLGGHFVQGHVDGTGQVVSITTEGETTRWRFSIPDDLATFVVEKGSIAVDGISLTVTAMAEGCFEVAVIPHTLAQTTLGTLREGHSVNLEADILAKYVHSMVSTMQPGAESITPEFLRQQGFC